MSPFSSRLSPYTVVPLSPLWRSGWHAGWPNWKKKGAKDRQDKEFWLTNLTTYRVHHVQGFAVRFLLCALF